MIPLRSQLAAHPPSAARVVIPTTTLSAGDDKTYLSPPGNPYNAVDLQLQFSSLAPCEAYSLICKRCGCKCIRSVSTALPATPSTWGTLTTLDLSRTYIGPRGVLPVAELCKVLGSLKSLLVADNYLDNQSVWWLSKMALFHPSLTRIDLSSNQSISWTGGMSLLDLACKNGAIASLDLSATSIMPSVLESIHAQLRRNAALFGSRRRTQVPTPCSHPITIRQRALKRFFREMLVQEKTSGEALPRRYLADGLKEYWKLSGRESKINQRTTEFFDSLLKRAPSDAIEWEAFMILIMVEGVEYNSQLVQHLRDAFNQFDVDGAGYVEVSDLRDILTMIGNGVAPSNDAVAAKMSFYDLSPKMSIRWDEFLLLMYDRGAVVGEVISQTARTPLLRETPIHH